MDVVLVRDRYVDSVAVVRRAPLHAAHVPAGTDERVPDEFPGLRVEDDVDTALLTDADDGALVMSVANLKNIRAGTTQDPTCRRRSAGCRTLGAPRYGCRLGAARSLPGGVT